ncbi:MAG: pyruvate dehydrogenase (acetyl-transferring), homodimeric type [Pseudomonadota bacterium]
MISLSADRQPGPDLDPQETEEWLAALEGVVQHAGPERARYLLRMLGDYARDRGLSEAAAQHSAYLNSIDLTDQPPYPGDLDLESRLTSLMRWNALCMVSRANVAHPELGGHIATYASAAEIFETGFHHFFRGPNAAGGGDLVYFQPHSSPGVYARSYLERRFDEADLGRFRREAAGPGLSAYPHPWLMPDYWQFPTGSMGIGPLSAIYQARFLRYLDHRGLADTGQRRVWGIFGDGEMDEPESLAGLSLAAREGLGNLTFIVNCNLQRLDGPVRGNGQIIQELEATFSGAGWRVLKVLWGSDWDPLFAADQDRLLARHFAETVDGQYQTLGANDGQYNMDHFFSLDPELRRLVAHLSPQDINNLHRGGHDPRKLFAALREAENTDDQPTVILAKTKKGFGMGPVGESRMTSHQQKKLAGEHLLEFRDRFNLPLSDAQATGLEFWRPKPDSAEYQYLVEQREKLGGFLPSRRRTSVAVAVPPVMQTAEFALKGQAKPVSTTTVFVRHLTRLLKLPDLGPRIVPIVADEARTFGMANLFRQIGIYSPDGQRYEPEDKGSLLTYREEQDGQLLEEGITEAGAICSWMAAATAYSTHNLPLLPVYIFYSVFGFQRVGDLIWAAADQRARGFLIGATAGRTTLSGEGLQHEDGASHAYAATVPACRAYDPAFGYELAVIVDHGARRMLDQAHDEFYYLTMGNEALPQAPMPESVTGEDIIGGLYRFSPAPEDGAPQVRLVAAGTVFGQAQEAAALLAAEGIRCELYSLTSASEVIRDAAAVTRHRRVDPDSPARSVLQRQLSGATPVVAVTDYVRSVVEPLAAYLEGPLTALGTDGYGRSDTRRDLRDFFEVSAPHIALAALAAARDAGTLDREAFERARGKLGIAIPERAPWQDRSPPAESLD